MAMNKKVYIYQDGTIPGHRIIEELERRGANNKIYSADKVNKGLYYYIYDGQIRMWYKCIAAPDSPLKGYAELLYDKEANIFYENTPVLSNSSNTGKERTIPFGAYDSELEGYEWNIPEGYEAKIEDGKVIVRKKKWQPKVGDTIWTVCASPVNTRFYVSFYTLTQEYISCAADFPTEEEAQAFCDKLNAAIKPILDERRKEIEK